VSNIKKGLPNNCAKTKGDTLKHQQAAQEAQKQRVIPSTSTSRSRSAKTTGDTLIINKSLEAAQELI
jgi:hypothetical protein